MNEMVSEAAKPLTQARIVERGSLIPAAEDASGPCVRGSAEETALFNLGFDLAASKAAGSVTGVEPAGPAFEAGLRNGQRLSGRLSVYHNQPEQDGRCYYPDWRHLASDRILSAR